MILSGTLVEIKSGGPTMTVGRKAPNDGGTALLTCHWFDDHGQLCKENFMDEQLRVLSEEELFKR